MPLFDEPGVTVTRSPETVAVAPPAGALSTVASSTLSGVSLNGLLSFAVTEIVSALFFRPSSTRSSTAIGSGRVEDTTCTCTEPGIEYSLYVTVKFSVAEVPGCVPCGAETDSCEPDRVAWIPADVPVRPW